MKDDRTTSHRTSLEHAADLTKNIFFQGWWYWWRCWWYWWRCW